jgi:hypothetical protein
MVFSDQSTKKWMDHMWLKEEGACIYVKFLRYVHFVAFQSHDRNYRGDLIKKAPIVKVSCV